MTQTFQSGFSTYLTRKLEAADTTAYVATAPTVTKGRIFITDGQNKERISYTGVSGSTLTWLTRWLSQTADPATSWTGTAWIAGTTIKLVAMHDQLPDKQEATTFWDVLTVSDTSVAGIRLQSLTTAQMNAIASPVNGDMIYNSTAWENYQYIGWAWSAVSAGSTQANSSTTVAGKVETATTAESIAANADTGGTGANLVVLPSDIAKNTQSATFVYGADAGGDDTYVVALTPVLASYTTGQRLQFKVTTANTGACSVDFWPWVKSIKTLDGNDPQTGAIRASQVVTVVYDGTNMILQNEDIASTTNKGIVELATDAEVLAMTDTSRVVTPAWLEWLIASNISVIAGTNVYLSADTERTNDTTSYTKIKEVTITRSGTYTIAWEHKIQTNPLICYTRVYKNGSAFGTEKTTSSASYWAVSDDLAFAVGDLCQLYIKTSSARVTAYAKNFKVKWQLSVNTNSIIVPWTVVTD